MSARSHLHQMQQVDRLSAWNASRDVCMLHGVPVVQRRHTCVSTRERCKGQGHQTADRFQNRCSEHSQPHGHTTCHTHTRPSARHFKLFVSCHACRSLSCLSYPLPPVILSTNTQHAAEAPGPARRYTTHEAYDETLKYPPHTQQHSTTTGPPSLSSNRQRGDSLHSHLGSSGSRGGLGGGHMGGGVGQHGGSSTPSGSPSSVIVGGSSRGGEFVI